MPVVSAGSNHAGASEAWTPHVIWPSGVVASAGAAIATDATASGASQRQDLVIPRSSV